MVYDLERNTNYGLLEEYESSGIANSYYLYKPNGICEAVECILLHCSSTQSYAASIICV